MKSGSFLNKKQAANLALLLGGFTIPSLFAASQAYTFATQSGPQPFWPFLLGGMLLWYYWAAFTPLIFWVSRRFPFESGRWLRSAPMHLLCLVILYIPKILLTAFVIKSVFQFTDATMSYWDTFNHLLKGAMETEILTYVCIAGGCMAFDYRKKYRERELYALQLQMQLSAAELSALKMQLHPHFLFNTLHTVTMLIRFQDSKAAIAVINGLSDLLRRSLEQTGKQTVTLREELELTDCYIDIEKIRFQDQIRITKEIAPEVLHAIVPNLLLQPLVENAIRHGVSTRESGGLIVMKAWREKENLLLEITDNGNAHTDELLPGNGIGLSNTQERLHHLYGTTHTFGINKDHGFSVLITIPYTNNR